VTDPVGYGYRAAFRAAPHALLAVDNAGVVRLASAEAERLLGRSGGDLVGQRVDGLLAGDPTWPLRTGAEPVPAGPVRATSALRLPDGRQVPVDLRMSALPAAGDAAAGRATAGRPTAGLESAGLESAGLADDAAARDWVVVSVDEPGEPQRARAALEFRLHRLTEAEREQERLLGDLIRAQERERARIAAGVHDDSLQVITVAMLRLQQLRRRLHDPGTLELLARLEEQIALAADRLRRLIFDFRPPALERSGLAAAVRDALSRLTEDIGIEVRLANELAEEPSLPTRTLLYRIIQEALFNVGAHAAARLVEVTLADQAGGYLVRVTDDGVGIPDDHPRSPEPGHLGVILMRERAEFAGGWFRIDSTPGAGTTVSAWVPRGADLETMPRPPALRVAPGEAGAGNGAGGRARGGGPPDGAGTR
jgi:signal transduction histidine kinase